MEIKAVKVFLFRHNKWYNCLTDLHNLNIDEKVVVESHNGLETGKVISQVFDFNEEKGEETFKIVRFFTADDSKQEELNKVLEKEVIDKSKALVTKFSLAMKVVEAFVSLDNSKIVVYFTADDRVDFRELVKQLAITFKTKIELRQIGSRDEVKLIGALGPCGKECCCSNSLNNFCQVSIKMAKVQNLSLNPANISGMCGRLMCCLSYENEHYKETFAKMPKINALVKTPDGEGVCVYNNLLKETVDVKFVNDNNSETKNYKLSAISF